MRLDARKGDVGWPCYDAKRCCMVDHVVWIDDQTATWCELVKRADPPFIDEIVRQEERITIYPSRRLVIFNGIKGADDEEDQVTSGTPVEVPA